MGNRPPDQGGSGDRGRQAPGRWGGRGASRQSAPGPGSPLPRVWLLCRAPFLLDLSLEAAPAAVGECDPLRSD